MDEPPAKRQRISEPISDTVDIESAEQNTHTNPSTPTRRKSVSYASPTKASLARSHPNILAKSPGRYAIESRGKTLRAELLGKQSNGAGVNDLLLSVTQSMPPQPEIAETEQRDTLSELPNDRDGFASAIASASASASVSTNAHDEPHLRQQQPQSARRTPLSSRQSRSVYSASRRRSRIDDVAFDLIVPKLVQRSESLPGQSSRSQSTEPELPPTPEQLGINPVPDRPRGLFSSSSIGSRSEGGRRRKRVGNETSTIISSPLKPRDHHNLLQPPSTDAPDAEPDIVQEAPESDMDEESGRVVSASALEVEAKRVALSDLEHTLDQYRQQTSNLEALTDAFTKNDQFRIDESTMKALLNDADKSRISTTMAAPDENALPYLNLFAPGNLILTNTTIPQRIKLRPQMVHKLTLAAPKPWPSTVLQLSFDILVDLEEERIGSIIQSKPGHFYKHKALQTWIEKRLEHPFYKHKMSELVWGVGQYFEACVQRARILKILSQKYGHEVVYANEAGACEKLTPREALVLCHYMDVSEVTFTSQANVERSEEPLARRILFTYDLRLSWTGNIAYDIDISITGVNVKAERGAKALFTKLLAYDDIVHAVDSVWTLLEFDMESTHSRLAGKEHERTQKSGISIPAT